MIKENGNGESMTKLDSRIIGHLRKEKLRKWGLR
jgi:hypothetical protein